MSLTPNQKTKCHRYLYLIPVSQGHEDSLGLWADTHHLALLKQPRTPAYYPTPPPKGICPVISPGILSQCCLTPEAAPNPHSLQTPRDADVVGPKDHTWSPGTLEQILLLATTHAWNPAKEDSLPRCRNFSLKTFLADLRGFRLSATPFCP